MYAKYFFELLRLRFIILLILVFHLAENSDFYEAATVKKIWQKGMWFFWKTTNIETRFSFSLFFFLNKFSLTNSFYERWLEEFLFFFEETFVIKKVYRGNMRKYLWEGSLTLKGAIEWDLAVERWWKYNEMFFKWHSKKFKFSILTVIGVIQGVFTGFINN